MKRWLFAGALALTAGLAVAADPPKPEAEQGEGVSLTVYNQNFVVVKERRLMDLQKGRSAVRFRDVAASIIPETVQFTPLRRPGVARVAEQNYEFDLVSADKLLGKYVDRDLAVVTRDGDTLRGRLLSYDEQALVLKTESGVDVVPRHGNVKDVQFSALPGGLLTRPTLVWQLDSMEGGKELVKVAYAARHMGWRVDYRARLNTAGDRVDLAGWVTLTNRTGTTFRDARLKLLAGDVNIVPDQPLTVGILDPEMATDGPAPADGRRRAFQEKSFGEYHLYELGRPATVKESESKQIELLDVRNIPATRKYAFRSGEAKVAVLAEFKNEEKLVKGLGVPLPKGPMRVFQRDVDGELELLGNDQIDHTPTDEVITVKLGYAFDVVGQRKQLAHRVSGNVHEHDFEITVRNHKTEAVKVDLLEAINGMTRWELLKQSSPHERRDVSTLAFPVEVKPNAEVTVTYTVRYTY
jgi:hypothetical protein